MGLLSRIRKGLSHDPASPARAVGGVARRLVLLAGALAVGAALWIGTLVTQRISPVFADLGVSSEGAFTLGGHFAGEPFEHGEGVRLWGSWAGSDDNTGALALGPFPAPALLRFGVGGYPTRAGNQIYVERKRTGARLPVKSIGEVGERWRVVVFSPPPEWIGEAIVLHARDDAKGPGGWLALSEPISGGRGGAGIADLCATLAAWWVSGLGMGLLWFAALRQVTARAWVAPHWAPLVAAAWVAVGGYATFWVYFLHPTLGKIFSSGLLLLGLIGALRRGKPDDGPGTEAMVAPRLLLVITLGYLALLHFYPSGEEFHALAANRFFAGLPGDNTLPRNVANALFHGEPLRQADADWLSSDRPPLQSGWLLLTWPVTAALGFEERTASGVAGVWLQSLWVLGAYGLLRSLGLARARAAAWLAVMALSGFFVQNTIFAWPKLSAAALACGAFGLWVLRPEGPPRHGSVALGAMLAALAWLSHGGVAFSFLALVPWVGWRAMRGEWRAWAGAAAVFTVFAAPWFAYQKFYDPPGNRLLKWHLAGVIPKDDRGTWRTIRESYATLTWRQIVAHKQANLVRQFEGDWRAWRDFSVAGSARRRADEFFLTARALTWWVLGLAALPFAIARGRRRAGWCDQASLAAWILATLVWWCGLMFSGGAAVIHQGSYATMLGLFVLLSVWLEGADRRLIALVAILQFGSLATTWAVPNAVIGGPVNRFALGLALAAGAGLVALVRREQADGAGRDLIGGGKTRGELPRECEEEGGGGSGDARPHA